MLEKLMDLIPNSKEKFLRNIPIYAVLFFSFLLFLLPFFPFKVGNYEYTGVIEINLFTLSEYISQWHVGHITLPRLSIILIIAICFIFAIINAYFAVMEDKKKLIISSAIFLFLYVLAGLFLSKEPLFSLYGAFGFGNIFIHLLPILTILVALFTDKIRSLLGVN